MNIMLRALSIKQIISRIFRNRNRPYVYVAIGDSTVEGIGASTPDHSYTGIVSRAVKETHKKAEYFNFGKKYAGVSDVIDTQLARAIECNPDLITISIGANDITKRTQVLQFEKDVAWLLKELKSKTHAEIVINTIPNVALSPWVMGKGRHVRTVSSLLTKRLNRILKKQAKRAGIILVDLYNASNVYMKYYPEIISQDGFHPSDMGYAIWATAILDHIEHLLLPERKRFVFW